jgi:hypothetical protein
MFTIELLNSIVKRDNCTLIGHYIHVNANTKLHYVCGRKDCSNRFSKTFRNVVATGAYCRECRTKQTIQKTKITCTNKFGVANVFQSQTIKDKIKTTCLQKYGVEHIGQSSVIKEKAKKTNMNKYGTDNVFASDLIKRSIKNTMLRKYGVDNPQRNKTIQMRTQETCIKKFGVSNPMKNQNVKDKGKRTNLQRYGVENTFQSEQVKSAIKQQNLMIYGVEHNAQRWEVIQSIKTTCMRKYGCENHMQNPDVFEKCMRAAYKTKKYAFEDGVEVDVQGYEPWALRLLEYAGYTSTDFTIDKKQLPCIWYDANNKKRRYYCDFYIPKERIVVEVKSTYTYKCDKIKLDKVRVQCNNLNLKFCLLVFGGKGVLDLEKCIF